MGAVRGVAVLAMHEVVVILVADQLVAAAVDVDVHVSLVRQVPR